jgi:hypothetical protein
MLKPRVTLTGYIYSINNKQSICKYWQLKSKNSINAREVKLNFITKGVQVLLTGFRI